MKNNLFKLALLAGAISLSVSGFAMKAKADGNKKVRCYGVAPAGQNDCDGNGHSCAGNGTEDCHYSEWKFMTKDQCAKLGGVETPKEGYNESANSPCKE